MNKEMLFGHKVVKAIDMEKESSKGAWQEETDVLVYGGKGMRT